jgi:hypothetical protein
MLQVGFEPTIPVFERAKTIHALERAATVIGRCMNCEVYLASIDKTEWSGEFQRTGDEEVVI